jgi:hypothetical protein
MAKRVRAPRWIWLLAAMTLVASSSGLQAGPGWKDGTSRAAVEGGQCVRPTEWMRRFHMDLVKHDRTVVVHQGVRTVDGSLAECIACHASVDRHGAYVPVDAPGEFCAGCHAYTGTTLDCFTCHAPMPVGD